MRVYVHVRLFSLPLSITLPYSLLAPSYSILSLPLFLSLFSSHPSLPFFFLTLFFILHSLSLTSFSPPGISGADRERVAGIRSPIL